MNLKIRSILERGDRQKERVTLRCTSDTDIGQYVLMQTSSSGGVVNTDVRQTMWLPDKLIQKGDLVVIYTRSGTQSEKVLTTGKKAHFLYWGIDSAIWSEDHAGVVLLHAPDWQARLAGEM